MSIQKIDPRTPVLVLFIVLTAGLRLLNAGNVISPIANFTPIGAMALFGGSYFSTNPKAFLFPLLTLFVSDVIMMQTFYKGYGSGLLYSGWYWTYAAFAVMVLIGRLIKKVSVKNVLIGAVAAALAHWLISDLGVWLAGGLDITTGKPYTRDVHGLIQCYVLAIPFMKNLLIGNLVYSGILFGGFELLQRKYPSLQIRVA